MVIGEHNVIYEPLVDRSKIIFPPLHIKLGIMKQIVKALDKDGACFSYISNAFPGLSEEKKKAGIFDGPQIRKLMRDEPIMNEIEKDAWGAFVKVPKESLGNTKAPNYVEIVDNLMDKLHKLSINMSIKVHFLFNHLEKFPNESWSRK